MLVVWAAGTSCLQTLGIFAISDNKLMEYDFTDEISLYQQTLTIVISYIILVIVYLKVCLTH